MEGGVVHGRRDGLRLITGMAAHPWWRRRAGGASAPKHTPIVRQAREASELRERPPSLSERRVRVAFRPTAARTCEDSIGLALLIRRLRLDLGESKDANDNGVCLRTSYNHHAWHVRSVRGPSGLHTRPAQRSDSRTVHNLETCPKTCCRPRLAKSIRLPLALLALTYTLRLSSPSPVSHSLLGRLHAQEVGHSYATQFQMYRAPSGPSCRGRRWSAPRFEEFRHMSRGYRPAKT